MDERKRRSSVADEAQKHSELPVLYVPSRCILQIVDGSKTRLTLPLMACEAVSPSASPFFKHRSDGRFLLIPEGGHRSVKRLDAIMHHFRLQRLQAITAEDVVVEGIVVPDVDYSVPDSPDRLDQEREDYARRILAERWDEEHEDGPTWEDNPWVWAIDFELTEHAFIREYEQLCRRYGVEIVETSPDLYGVAPVAQGDALFMHELSTSFQRKALEINAAAGRLRDHIRKSFDYCGVHGHLLRGGELRRFMHADSRWFETREQRCSRLETLWLNDPRSPLTEKEERDIIRKAVDEKYDAIEKRMREEDKTW